jgi:hypothetical protein
MVKVEGSINDCLIGPLKDEQTESATRQRDPNKTGETESPTGGSPAGPKTPPAPPNSDPNKPPVTKPSSWGDNLKIFFVVVIWYVTTDANRALIAHVDYTKLAVHPPIYDFGILGSVILIGGFVGLIQGVILAIKALVFFWAGPSFFELLTPVLTAAAKFPTEFVANLRRAWMIRPTPVNNSPGDTPPSDTTDNK